MSADVAEKVCSHTDRPKVLRRQRTPGERLDLALLNTGVSKAEVARRWGISRPLVHHVIDGRKPLTEARMQLLPPLVYDEYRRLEARDRGRVWVDVPPSPDRVDMHAAIARLSRDHSETIQAYLQSYADGVASPGEKAAIARELREDIEAAASVLAALEAE